MEIIRKEDQEKETTRSHQNPSTAGHLKRPGEPGNPLARYFEHFARHVVSEFLSEAQQVFSRWGAQDQMLVRQGVCALNVTLRAGMKDAEVPARASLRKHSRTIHKASALGSRNNFRDSLNTLEHSCGEPNDLSTSLGS